MLTEGRGEKKKQVGGKQKSMGEKGWNEGVEMKEKVKLKNNNQIRQTDERTEKTIWRTK